MEGEYIRLPYGSLVSMKSIVLHSVTIGKYCIIERDCLIRPNTVIMDYVKLMPGTKIGEHCKLDDYVNTSGYCEIGNYVRIKRNTMIGQAVRIRDNAWIGSGVRTTRIKYPKVTGLEEKEEWIEIGESAMVGSDVLILAGVTIGHHAIIGAGSLVTKNCEPYGVYIGRPAKFVRYNKKEE
jgi:acetyltransferase-like isoleucine patch superfamily enzyme